jgi:hypothetical protein
VPRAYLREVRDHVVRVSRRRDRGVASWTLTPPGKLADADRTALTEITACREEFTATPGLVREFADVLQRRHGEHLEASRDG